VISQAIFSYRKIQISIKIKKCPGAKVINPILKQTMLLASHFQQIENGT
jgi:hypothetical protein